MLELRLRAAASVVPAAPPPATAFRLLVRLFLRRFLDNDLLSPRGDGASHKGMLLALLASPGLFSLVWLLLAYSGPFITPSERLLMALDHKYRFAAASMVIAALAAALEWDALSLDARDAAILGPLPISPRRLLGAKLAALGLFLLALTAAVNLIPAVVFPVIWMSLVPIGLLHVAWLVVVHGLVCLAAASAGFLLVVAVRSLVTLVVGARLLRRVSAAAQAFLVFVFAGLFLLLPLLPADVLAVLESPSREAFVYPPLWFVGAYERATAPGLYADPRLTADSTWTFWERQQLRRQENRGPEVWAHPLPLFKTETAARQRYQRMTPVLGELAATADAACAGLAAAGGLLYFLAHLRERRREREAMVPRIHGRRVVMAAAGRTALNLAGRAPIARAVFAFTLQTLRRSAPHRVRVAAALALGGALVAEGLMGQVQGSSYFPAAPTASLLGLEYLLAFFLLAGFRRTLDVPAALEASWIFRLLDGRDAAATRAGARRAMVAAGVLPLFAVLSLLHLVLWGPAAAVMHLLAGTLLSLVLVELLLFGFRSVPFASTRPAGDARLRWPCHAVACVAFVFISANLEVIALSGPRALAVVGVLAVAAVAAARFAASRQPAAAREVVFDEEESAGIRLGQ